MSRYGLLVSGAMFFLDTTHTHIMFWRWENIVFLGLELKRVGNKVRMYIREEIQKNI